MGQRRTELACHAGLESSLPGWAVYHTAEVGVSGGGCLALRDDSGKASVFRWGTKGASLLPL